ncbi:DUF2800 domain-containing protein [uncultured Muribaculum sp.]|uniref:DUF2800 domain-containing protein n=1 Tax=uncultured Muribaculum sp. TaxID=1918613 RepID=UPI00266F19E7|nr:DUF2800 domain-containing protein [uncultured Muribaculum sp.]
MSGQHALLSPSAAHRWMNCTAAPRLEATMPDKESPYAQEGTLAHAYCAKKLKSFMGLDTKGEEKEIAQLNDKYHTGEMDEYTDTYMTIVLEKFNAARSVTKDAQLLIETRLDFSEYVPEAFGTSDTTIIADGLMEVIDFKYGKGVRVSAVDNEQMKIYALGAYLKHSFEYRIDRVRMAIVQPRIDNLSEFEMSIADLLKWADEELRPKAIEAFGDHGKQNPGEWCQFCKVKCGCNALAEKCTSIAQGNPDPGLIPPKKMAADILPWLAIIKSWVSSMEDYALQQALAGVSYPGYKLVEGRSNRKITDDKAVIALLSKEGYDESEYMKPAVLCGIGDLEKLVGKKRLAAICADYITKPQGKPTLTTADDKRPAYNAAADDFNDIEV